MKDVCARKHGGNRESREAFAGSEESFANQERELIKLLASHPEGLTNEEMEMRLGLRQASVSARSATLKRLGIFVRKWLGVDGNGKPIYERKLNRSGKFASVLVLNPKKEFHYGNR
jgi:hypothetical protein